MYTNHLVMNWVNFLLLLCIVSNCQCNFCFVSNHFKLLYNNVNLVSNHFSFSTDNFKLVDLRTISNYFTTIRYLFRTISVFPPTISNLFWTYFSFSPIVVPARCSSWSGGHATPKRQGSPSLSSFAGSKCYEPPSPSSLPKPPTVWFASEPDFRDTFDDLELICTELKHLLKVEAWVKPSSETWSA